MKYIKDKEMIKMTKCTDSYCDGNCAHDICKIADVRRQMVIDEVMAEGENPEVVAG